MNTSLKDAVKEMVEIIGAKLPSKYKKNLLTSIFPEALPFISIQRLVSQKILMPLLIKTFLFQASSKSSGKMNKGNLKNSLMIITTAPH